MCRQFCTHVLPCDVSLIHLCHHVINDYGPFQIHVFNPFLCKYSLYIFSMPLGATCKRRSFKHKQSQFILFFLYQNFAIFAAVCQCLILSSHSLPSLIHFFVVCRGLPLLVATLLSHLTMIPPDLLFHCSPSDLPYRWTLSGHPSQ